MQEYRAEQAMPEKPSTIHQLLRSNATPLPKKPTLVSPVGSPVSTPTLPMGTDKSMRTEPATLVARDSGLLSPDLSNAEVTMKKVHVHCTAML